MLWSIPSLSLCNLDLYSFPQKTLTTPWNACQAFFSVSVIFSFRVLDFNMVAIWGPTNIPPFSLASDICGIIALISWNVSLFKSKALTNCFTKPNFIWRGGNKTFSLLTSDSLMTLYLPGVNSCLGGQGTSRSALHQLCCSISKENTRIWYSHPGDPTKTPTS